MSVHSVPLFFSRPGLCPLLPALLPSCIAPLCLFRVLAQPFGSMAAPCWPHSLPCLTHNSYSPSLSGYLPPVICGQWWLWSPVPSHLFWIFRAMPTSYVFLLTSLPLSQSIRLFYHTGILKQHPTLSLPYPWLCACCLLSLQYSSCRKSQGWLNCAFHLHSSSASPERPSLAIPPPSVTR